MQNEIFSLIIAMSATMMKKNERVFRFNEVTDYSIKFDKLSLAIIYMPFEPFS